MSSSNQWGKTDPTEQYEPFGSPTPPPGWATDPEPAAEGPVAEPWYRKGPPIRVTLKWIMYVWLVVFGVLVVTAFVTGFVVGIGEGLSQ
ncbi:putative membrane protein [Rhodococcus phage Mbo2]|uniref:Membrane protein n=1 Tax=Rhodococcus phage Mbo2 TaxID=2936911 RepID=A0A9E7IN41_9CAUD|nr:putative membrane protein [Rhodococcus phage Mbo2]